MVRTGTGLPVIVTGDAVVVAGTAGGTVAAAVVAAVVVGAPAGRRVEL